MKFSISHSFFTVVIDSIKLLPKNGKLMAMIALFSILLTSAFFWLFSYILKSLVIDMSVTAQRSFMPDPNSFATTDPNSFNSVDPSPFTPQTDFNPAQITGLIRHLQEDTALILIAEIAFFLVCFIISFFTTISTVLVSALSYTSKNSSLKQLFSTVCKMWTRPLITTFYVSALAIGYFIAVFIFVAPLLVYRNKATLYVAVLIGIVSSVFYLYLVVAWALAIMVSVMEENCYGLKALVKGETLVEGKRLVGLLLNVCFNVVVSVIFVGYQEIVGNKWLENPTMHGLFVVNFLFLVKIFIVVVYTVLYFECKEHHGEEIELHGEVQYSKLQNKEVANDMA